MATKKRHSPTEIAAKLRQANDLAAEGKLQPEIARAIGVSVMTLHRWRKQFLDQPHSAASNPAFDTAMRSSPPDESANRIAELRLENARLRKLVTDLMLERMSLEETAQNEDAARRTVKR
jgi:transposase-like protein